MLFVALTYQCCAYSNSVQRENGFLEHSIHLTYTLWVDEGRVEG